MSIKSTILSIITAHLRLVTLGIGLGVTFGMGLATGVVSPHQEFAGDGIWASSRPCIGGS